MDLYYGVRWGGGGRGWGSYIRDGVLYLGKKTLQYAICYTYYFSFFLQCKACILAYFSSCNMWNMFKINNKGTRIRRVNDKVNNKDTIDVVLVSLLLTFNTFDYLLQSFYFWIGSVNCRLELLLVVLTLCSCWNQFRKSFHFWRN